MIEIESTEYPGIEYIKNNMPEFKDKLIKDTIIVFRNANLTFEEQEELQLVMGDYLGWFPNNSGGHISRYIEDHAQNEYLKETSKDEVVLLWHVEHPYFDNPIVAGLWNMLTFNIPEGYGNTLFVDTGKVYSLLSIEDQDFLNKCIVNSYSYANETMRQIKPIKEHWLTKEPIIRISLERIEDGWHDLHSFDGRNPTQKEKEKFLELGNWIVNQIHNNEEIRITHRWQKGDLIIPDLHKLAHAVMGGFSPEDRRFTGLWSYQIDNHYKEFDN